PQKKMDGTKVANISPSSVKMPIRRFSATEGMAASRAGLLSNPIVHSALPFINGGAAGMLATTIIQPIDMVKVRLQLAPHKTTALKVTKEILASGKVLDLYSGLSAGLLRQAVYTTARMGFFGTFIQYFNEKAKNENRSVTFGERSAASLLAGALGATLGNP